MAVSEDKCIQCGNRHRPTDLEQISPSESLDPDGSFMGLPYWFCSVDCYKKAIRKFLEPRYDFDKQPEDDEECQERIKEALIDYYVKAGEGGFLERWTNPVGWTKPGDYIRAEKEAAIDAFQTKKHSEIVGAEIELQNRLFAEWTHSMEQEKAEWDKESAKRQVQIEKKMSEERELEAEEEKWRPKPFNV